MTNKSPCGTLRMNGWRVYLTPLVMIFITALSIPRVAPRCPLLILSLHNCYKYWTPCFPTFQYLPPSWHTSTTLLCTTSLVQRYIALTHLIETLTPVMHHIFLYWYPWTMSGFTTSSLRLIGKCCLMHIGIIVEPFKLQRQWHQWHYASFLPIQPNTT